MRLGFLLFTHQGYQPYRLPALCNKALKNYYLLASVRGDLLSKLDRFTEAQAEFERAASLTSNERERHLLLERAATCASRAGD